ncbi:MAG: hypothetical protein KIT18_13165 [Burkholderiales bacterium]|nr:hypothetical protein [Burkholderiales bacterium]
MDEEKAAARMVRAQAALLHGLDFDEARCVELAHDVERHVTAIATASPSLDFNDEPARFAALLATSARDGKARR